MNPMHPKSRGVPGLACALVLAVCFAAGERADAQALKPPTGDKPPIKPTSPNQPDEPSPGMLRCRIIKFEVVDGEKTREKDQDLAAYVMVRPLSRNARPLRLAVLNGGNVSFVLGRHALEESAWKDFPWKGLHCEVNWVQTGDDPLTREKEPARKELRSLSFELLEVMAEIERIEDGAVVLRALPKAGRPWPDAEPPDKDAPKPSPAPKEPAVRKLRLKVLDGITTLLDEKGGEADLKDFQPGQRVEATLVLGSGDGILVSMPPVGEDDKPGETGGGDDRRPPRGRPGGVTPRGPQG